MKSPIRIAGAVVTFVAVFYFSFLVVFTLISRAGPVSWISLPGALLLAVLAARFVWRRPAATATDSIGVADSTGASHPGGAVSLGRAVGMGALLTGAVGFVGGFFGPMILAPSANQGPMLGIFITGPLGVILGAVGGGIYWMARSSTSRNTPRF